MGSKAEFICKLDESKHKSLEDLHKYIRRFKLSQKAYYHEYFPRKDLLTGELIPYNSYDQYFSQEFISKENLRKWILGDKENGPIWAKKWMENRKVSKKLKHLPTQAELKSLVCPTVHYYQNSYKGGFEELGRELGLNCRFDYDSKPKFSQLPKDTEIIQDTREQTPISLSRKIIEQKLDVGDYAISGKLDVGTRIERKSLLDFCGTLGKANLERFKRELKRAVKNKQYVIMMVEVEIEKALQFDKFFETRHVKTSPAYIFKHLRDLLTAFPKNFQALFVEDRVKMADSIIKVFELGESVKTTDLQYWYELGEL